MHVVSVNVGKARAFQDAPDGTPLTGIFKMPVLDAVMILEGGLDGDQVCNGRYHGGPDQAVYIYSAADYAWWESRLGRTIDPGTFGENLTFDRIDHASLGIGDRFCIGDAVRLEITAPRIPCGTLARRMESTAFVKEFRKAERPGVYCRVLRGGAVAKGDAVQLERCSGTRVGVLQIYRSEFALPSDEAALRSELAAPLAIRLRRKREDRLRKLMEAPGPDSTNSPKVT